MREAAADGASSVLVGLDDPACEDPGVAGNKASRLGALLRAGFDVPPGVVLPATAFAGADDELPAMVRAALEAVPGRLGPGPWAVRSSGMAEDAERASFAGQFETLLNVDSPGLAEAVLHCWRSRRAARARAYGGDDSEQSMAVLIQAMVVPEAAGVAFTMDPVTRRRRTVIEAVGGLGDRLVSGTTNPERWTIEEDGSLGAPTEATVLGAERARAIGALGRRVEEQLGCPQDIEWAIAGDSFWLLQARPITTVSPPESRRVSIPIEVPPGVWTRDAFHEPVPLSPFGRVVLTEQVLRVLPDVFARFGILLERGEVAFIGGWLYNRLVPTGAPPPGGGSGSAGSRQPPRWLLSILMRLHPAVRRRTRAADRAVAIDLPYQVIRTWTEEWRPEHERDAARALDLDLRSLTDRELAAQLDHRLDVIAHPAHAMVSVAYFILVHELATTCHELLGWDTTRMLTLLEGLSTASTEPSRQLARLARLAEGKPALRELLTDVDEDTPDRLAVVDPQFAEAFARYVENTGHRAVRYDVIEPTLAERPHLLLRLVADQLELGYSPDRVAEAAGKRRTAAADEARRLLASHGPQERERFERSLARAREAYPALEDRVWWTQSVQTALLRYLALEIGHRLVDRGQLATVDDVFYLEALDARSALFDGTGRDETARIAMARRAWAIGNPGPLAYGAPPSGPPPFDLLPPAARLVNEAVLWGFSQFFGAAPVGGNDRMVGIPASAGTYTGTVRVVMGEEQFARIRRGDVVVCPATSPAWSLVFPSIGALIADSGGVLSHPAIIAREHGIPAVVGAGNATAILRDGQLVTVDGSTGVIVVAGGTDLDHAGQPGRPEPD
jgi:pyruvate,water dikinase